MTNQTDATQTEQYRYVNTWGGYDVYLGDKYITGFTTSSALSDAKRYVERANKRLEEEQGDDDD